MDDTPWRQINLAYPGNTRQDREQHAISHLAGILPAAEADGLITSWWFMRKGAWRIRYLPTKTDGDRDPIRLLLTDTVPGTTDIYEPEIHAFGGAASMAAAHELFHHDSHHLLAYLHGNPTHRREHSLILCTVLMRAAGLDPNEQGDVWARIAQRRSEQPVQSLIPDTQTWAEFTQNVRHLLLGRPIMSSNWHTTFADTGVTMRNLRESGELTRGLRAVITEHVVFHWNRLGIPATAQATLAHAAKEAIFGTPTYAQQGRRV